MRATREYQAEKHTGGEWNQMKPQPWVNSNLHHHQEAAGSEGMIPQRLHRIDSSALRLAL